MQLALPIRPDSLPDQKMIIARWVPNPARPITPDTYSMSEEQTINKKDQYNLNVLE